MAPMRCTKQYFEFWNHQFSQQLEQKYHLSAKIPSEVLILISEFSAESQGIVIDNGSGFLQAGFVGQDAPKTVFENVISTYYLPKDSNGGKNIAFWVGNDEPGNLSARVPRFDYRPMDDRGLVCNWDELERIWKHTFFNELRVDPKDHPVLLTEPPLNPKANRERMARILLETLGVPAIYVGTTSVLALFASGRTTGCVVDSGYSATHIVPIYEGHVLAHAVVSMNVGGRHLTDWFQMLIYMRERVPPTSLLSKKQEREVLCDMKETLCFVSMDFEQDVKTSSESSVLEKPYELPDGNILNLGNERFLCPEALFQPNLMGLEEDSIAASIVKAIETCGDDIGVLTTMYSNIVLSGGNTKFPGLRERLSKEINDSLAVARPSFQVDTIIAESTQQNQRQMSWIGGSILASLPQFQLRAWITKEEYEEFGPSILHKDRLSE